MNSLKKYFQNEISKQLMSDLNITNVMAVPKVTKIVINTGVKDAVLDKKVLDIVTAEIAQISGQKPVVTRAKKAIAGFKLRKGDPVGVMVTLRGKKRDDFLEKLVTIVLPRFRDFRGISRNSFDNKGNYTLGIKEQIVFPEIDYSKIDKIRSLEVTICTNSKNKQEAFKLFELLRFPFTK